MGEYATYKGKRIKIGTCENMYYLRPDQIDLVEDEHGLFDHLDEVRFRFPFPDEDHVNPGAFDPYNRRVGVYAADIPAGVKHEPISMSAGNMLGALVPCPLSPEGRALAGMQGMDGYSGIGVKYYFTGDAVRISQQRLLGGLWVTVAECGACGSAYRMPTLRDAEPLILALRTCGDRELIDPDRRAWWHAIADRVTAGYTNPTPIDTVR